MSTKNLLMYVREKTKTKGKTSRIYDQQITKKKLGSTGRSFRNNAKRLTRTRLSSPIETMRKKKKKQNASQTFKATSSFFQRARLSLDTTPVPDLSVSPNLISHLKTVEAVLSHFYKSRSSDVEKLPVNTCLKLWQRLKTEPTLLDGLRGNFTGINQSVIIYEMMLIGFSGLLQVTKTSDQSESLANYKSVALALYQNFILLFCLRYAHVETKNDELDQIWEAIEKNPT